MPIPDVKAAVIEHLLASGVVTAVTTKIGSVHKQEWGAEPGYMLLVRLSGNPGEEVWRETNFHVNRLDFEFHGPTPELATEFWRTVHPILCPDQADSATIRSGFTREGCRVVWLEKESGPLELTDPDDDRKFFTGAAYIAVYAGRTV